MLMPHVMYMRCISMTTSCLQVTASRIATCEIVSSCEGHTQEHTKHTHTHTHTHRHTHRHTRARARARAHIHIHIHTHAHTHLHPHIHTHVYIHMSMRLVLCACVLVVPRMLSMCVVCLCVVRCVLHAEVRSKCCTGISSWPRNVSRCWRCHGRYETCTHRHGACTCVYMYVHVHVHVHVHVLDAVCSVCCSMFV